jgi:hypothetical protein
MRVVGNKNAIYRRSQEKENLLTGHTDWNYDDNFKLAKQEIEHLYNWWLERLQHERNNDIDPIWTDKQYEIDNEMLIRLIKIRKYLWT